MRLVKAALGEALLGAASVWKIVSITRIFALASGQAEPSDVALILAVQYVLGLLLLTFKTYHVETKDELSTEIENALYRALVPSLLAFKMLAIEDVIFNLSKTQHALGAPVDILQALALIQQTATSCEDLVRSASILAELAQLENIIESKLAKNTFRSYNNGSRSSSKKIVIEITGAVFKRGIDDPFTLYVNQLSVESGKLVAVTGDVGAGKSTLLLAMLRELNMVTGESRLNGSVAYVDQSPWIMGSTIKENITFGKEVNDVLYRQAVSLCCLDDEVNQMSGGDSTVVSNQGSTLSGGQRARLALARIWKQVVSDTGFLKNKTRVIVTNDRKYVEQCHIFVGERTSYIASIVYSVYNTYLISFAMLPVLVAVSVSFVWLRKHSIDVLLAVQKYKVQTSEIKDKIVFNIFSGSLTVRVFDAYDVFGGRILTQDNQIATVHRLANAIVNTRMFYQAVIEQFLVLFLVGTMVVKSDHDATVDVRMYYEILTRSLPLLNYLLNIHLEARNYAFVLQEFCDKAKLVSEGARNTNATVVPETWVQEGRIEFSDITLRYNDEKKAALRKVALCIQPGEKIGIVGRTGSGKSSLINALLRIVELETGTIKIDGVDISQIGVHNLRKQISVVPQMAALFRGTLRANLDPSDKYSNEKVDVAIKAAGLEAWGPDKLIENNGINISAGEQKLIGICRAILQQRKIVILDEATANINNKAEEQLVRNVIASEFENSTVLTIAHRMETVRNSDRVLVMSRGRVAEFGTPAALVAQGGRFAKLVAAERSQQ
ncbi:ABC transporter C member 13 [Coemansia sp. RSA 564]|nr:ABC transporter C member 13 [Coemansia sp. RSA 564]